MKHEPIAVANAVTATTAIVFVVCRVLVALFPDLLFTIAQSWFHGIALSKLDSWNLTLGSFVFGFVSATITAWIIGYTFTKLYNYFLKAK